MSVQETSVQAFRSLEKINFKQKACYNVIILYGPVCNQDIAEKLGWEINRVTPRVKELRERGLVDEFARAVNPKTDRKVIYWEVARPKQQELFN